VSGRLGGLGRFGFIDGLAHMVVDG
jgi:hypothetical protein